MIGERWLSGLAATSLAMVLSPMAFAESASIGDDAKSEGRLANNTYIVQLADPPVVSYSGGVPGYAATRPAKGQKVNPNNPDVVRYLAYLRSRQDGVLAKVGGGRKHYNYGYAFNGLAAELTPTQVQALKRIQGVSVSKDEARRPDTSTTPAFLGISGPGGFWEATGAQGENVIIGIVDSGIWPEHPSFSDRTHATGNGAKGAKGAKGGMPSYQQIPGWHGRCVPGEAFVGSDCNHKLIGARYYNAGFGGNEGVKAMLPYEYLSPRDFDGHGTHTASTAGGNAQVQVTGPASLFGTISGMAPRARIAAYKVCWGTGNDGGCYNSDSVAAIDQAVADGVDVINFSISGSQTNFLDPVEVAFMNAASAGVFVAASAGNSGPTVSTVAHPGPWLTTVAAATHNRIGQGSATLGNQANYSGASLATAVGPLPLIAATTAGLPGADPALVALCYAAVDNGGVPVLDPARVAGKIVVCNRGVTSRTNKSQAVADAGGLGMILVNTSPNSLNADLHVVPTVHLPDTSRAEILAYATTEGATATIHEATLKLDEAAPFTASFSSRGPLRAGGGDLLKPDIIAPGQDVLAGVSPMGHNGKEFDLLSGTSMSSPHIAGIAALIKEAKPGWSPMAIKSALMTTAGDVLDGPNTNPVVIFRQGAGHVNPNAALEPGLVFDQGLNDWQAFLCGVSNAMPASTCSALVQQGRSTDPSDLNLPSIAIGDLAGVQTVTRRVTNVGNTTATYTASVEGLSGFNVSLPGSFALAPGASKTIEITFLRTSATLNAYVGAQITLSDGTHNVRIPVVVRPVAMAAPAQVGGSYSVRFGYEGSFSASPRGLVPADIHAGTVGQDPDQTFDPADATGTVAIQVEIPAGTTYARYALFEADVASGADLDLYVYQGSVLVGGSANLGSGEEVSFDFSTPTTSPIMLTVFVHGWGAPTGMSSFKLHRWALGSQALGNMVITAPTSAEIGGAGQIDMSFLGLASSTKYLGSVAYSGAAGLPKPTIIRVDTP